MEELLVYAILLSEELVTENEYNKRLDELFLNLLYRRSSVKKIYSISVNKVMNIYSQTKKLIA